MESDTPRIAGIVMECNPFHEGHQYILEQARSVTGARAVVVVLSGDYAQRGIPTVYSKESRTRQLLLHGADLVLELPVCSAVSSAEYFASGAVKILQRIGIITDLVFGSESGSLEELQTQAEFMLHEPSDYQELLRSFLSHGLSFPAAREKAALECAAHLSVSGTANDILGVEYLKALMTDVPSCRDLDTGRTSRIRAHAIPRIPAVSATQHRKNLQEAGAPSCLFADDFSELLLGQLLSIRQDPQHSYAEYAGISSDLSDRIERLLPEYLSWTQFCQLLKTRNITYSAISRAMLHILLHMTNECESSFQPSYARVLGCRKDASYLLGRIASQKDPDFTLITNLARQFPEDLAVPTAPSGRKSPRNLSEPAASSAGQLPEDLTAPAALSIAQETIRRSLALDLRASELYDYVARRKALKGKIPAAASAAASISEYSKAFLML